MRFITAHIHHRIHPQPLSTYLQAVADNVEDGADGGADGGEAEAREEGGNGRRELDEERADVLASDDKELLHRLAEVLDKLTNGASLADDLADGDADHGQSETAEQSSDLRGELDEEGLEVLAEDGEDLIDLGGDVLDNLAVTLNALAEGVDDLADGDADLGKTETANQASDLRGQLDQKSAAILANNSEEVLDGTAKVLHELTDGAGLADDLANGDADLGKAETAKQSSDLRGELDEERLEVLAEDGEDLIDLGGSVLNEMAALARGGEVAGEVGGDVAAATAGKKVGDGAVVVLSRCGDGGGRKGGDGSEEGGLHFEDCLTRETN
jgi:hypothetical protein